MNARRVLLFGPATTVPPDAGTLMRHDAFAAAFARGCDVAAGLLGWNPGTTSRTVPAAEPPSDFARNFMLEVVLQLATYAALQDAGFRADAVAGLSLGELAAAHAAGAVSFDDTLRIACAMVKEVVADDSGDLVLIDAPGSDCVRILSRIPSYFVMSWARESIWAVPDKSIRRLRSLLVHEGLGFTELNIRCMPHTEHVNGRRFADAVTGIAPRAPALPLYSTVVGGRVDREIDTEFWIRMCTEPIAFDGMQAAFSGDGLNCIVHVGSVGLDARMNACVNTPTSGTIIPSSAFLSLGRTDIA